MTTHKEPAMSYSGDPRPPEEPTDWAGIAMGVAVVALCFMMAIAEMGWPG